MKKLAIFSSLALLATSLSVTATMSSDIRLVEEMTIEPKKALTISLDKLNRGAQYHVSCLAASQKADKRSGDVVARFQVIVPAPGKVGNIQWGNSSFAPPTVQAKLPDHPYYYNLEAYNVTLYADGGNAIVITNLDDASKVHIVFCQAEPVLTQ